ncbi:hypothetical protein [Rhodoplanes elegans]|nr:hypothetical protein [Rhodoplanes elegans]
MAKQLAAIAARNDHRTAAHLFLMAHLDLVPPQMESHASPPEKSDGEIAA